MPPLLHHPGYTLYLIHRWSLYYTPPLLHAVQDDDALGSNLGLCLGNEAKRASQSPILLWKSGPDAHNPSGFPGKNG